MQSSPERLRVPRIRKLILLQLRSQRRYERGDRCPGRRTETTKVIGREVSPVGHIRSKIPDEGVDELRGWREITQGPYSITGRVGLVVRRRPHGLFLREGLMEYGQKLGSGCHGFRTHPGEHNGGAFSNIRAGTLEAFAEQRYKRGIGRSASQAKPQGEAIRRLCPLQPREEIGQQWAEPLFVTGTCRARFLANLLHRVVHGVHQLVRNVRGQERTKVSQCPRREGSDSGALITEGRSQSTAQVADESLVGRIKPQTNPLRVLRWK